MGPTALLPSERSRAADFIALKNPLSSAGFEPIDPMSNGKHATTRTLMATIVILSQAPGQKDV
jgi:hypothetical protein